MGALAGSWPAYPSIDYQTKNHSETFHISFCEHRFILSGHSQRQFLSERTRSATRFRPRPIPDSVYVQQLAQGPQVDLSFTNHHTHSVPLRIQHG